MSKEDFKFFVRNNPSLINYVNNKEKTWQDFYELYELYGPTHNIWSKYIKNSNSSSLTPEEAIKELVNMIKGIDIETVQKGINNVQKTISLVQDLGFSSSKGMDTYQSKPLFKHFED